MHTLGKLFALPWLMTLGTVGLVFGQAAATPTPAKDAADAPPARTGPVVVELFTSEGCSSCPPADSLLSELVRKHDAGDRAGLQPGVVFIAWHVDYWDQLGWKDPYSTGFASHRQRDYDSIMSSRGVAGAGVYTPQMIINGQRAFVGSDRGRAEASIRGAIADRKTAGLELSLSQASAGGPVSVRVTAESVPEHSRWLAVLLEDNLVTDVKLGENGGRKLAHTRVARSQLQLPARDKQATLELTIPAGLRPELASVVVLLESKDSGFTLAAGTARLIPAEAPAAGERP
jgi:hypothetical protein